MEFATGSCRFDDVRKVVLLKSAVQSPTCEKVRFRTTTPRYFVGQRGEGILRKQVRTHYIETALRALNSSDRELSQSLLHSSKHRPAGCFQHIKYSFKERRKKQAYRLCSVKIINMRFSNILSAFL